MKECPVCRRCFSDEINHCPQDGDATAPTLVGEPTLDARYLLERRLGQGGMGVVFQARHIFLKTAHAIKVILPDLVGNDPMLATRFRQEALAAAAIRHQNIIAVTDFGMVRGIMPFLVMEFIKGKSLQEILAQEGAMPPGRAWELISAVASGVGAAHRQNIVHRDLKPLNIMLQDDMSVAEGLKILDFGLAKIKSGDLLGSFVQAKTSGLMGSPFYMAPEQWSDDEPDTRADIYSLGIILYQMLAGEVPFKGSSIPSIMKKHLTLLPPSFQSMGVSVPPQIEAVVRHSLEKEVEARIDSVDSFLRELRAAMNSTPIEVRPARETGGLDPNQTMISEPSASMESVRLSDTAVSPSVTNDTNLGPSFGSLAGTVSAAALDSEMQTQLSDTAAAHRREKEEQERIAKEEAENKRREEEERLRKEQEDRETRDREQQEKFERMAVQAKELEDRLERLSVSMSSPTTASDLETSRAQELPEAPAVTLDSFSDRQTIQSQSQPIATALPLAKKRTPLLLIAAGVAVLMLGSVAIGAFLIWRSKATTAVVKPPIEKTEPPAIKADLVAISGGTFQMGRDNGALAERPAHPIQVQSFFMDKTEVSNSEYADFVRDTNHTPPVHWAGTRPPFGQELWPVVNVSLEDASAFAAWRSKRDGAAYRLPTEEEWEYAARNGSQGDLYPWGKDWNDKYAVLKEATPAPVGSRPEGANKWGVSDLIGNVWEWTSSKVSIYPGNPSVMPSSMKDLVTIRGACYVSKPDNPDAPISSAMREFIPPATKTTLLGFRLVRSGS